MTDREKKVVLAAPSFQSPISIALHDQFKQLFKPEEMTLRSLTDDADIQKERLVQMLNQLSPVGLIALDIHPDAEIVAACTAERIPIILFDEEADGTSSISTDNVVGGRIAGEYLIKKGRKKMAIVSGRTKVKGGFNAERRLKGFQQALTAKGISIPAGGVIEVPHYSREDGFEVMPKLLDLGIDAIFCAAGDTCALGLLSVAKEMNRHVPDEVAIIGFDDLLIARLSTPALTTIRQPLDRIAEAAFNMIMKEKEQILQRPKKLMFHP